MVRCSYAHLVLSSFDFWLRYDVPRMFGIEGTQPLKVHLDEGIPIKQISSTSYS